MSEAISRRVYYLTPAGGMHLRQRIHEARLAYEAVKVGLRLVVVP